MKRAKRKGPYQKWSYKKNKFNLLPRNFEITSNFINKTFSVHSGKKISSITILENMIGHKVGEFIPTREKFEFKKKRAGSKKKKN